MRTLTALFIAIISCVLPAAASTLSFNGNVYSSGMPPDDYFILNPTKVGQTTSVRFYDDGCPRIAEEVASWGETLLRCYLLGGGSSYNWVNNFFSLTYDGSAGATPETENFFFTLSFSPTRYIDLFDPNLPEEDYFLLSTFVYIENSWQATYSGNNEFIYGSFEAAIAPVPLPAAMPVFAAVLALPLAFGKRRRRRKSGRPSNNY